MENDEFGRDPAVRSMRRVFAGMEKLHREITGAASISSLDRRLPVWREQALRIFEQAWSRAGRRGLARTEEEAAQLYALCLIRILERGKVTVPSSATLQHDALEEVIREVLG